MLQPEPSSSSRPAGSQASFCCPDEEPIHLSAAVQPHGVALVLSKGDWQVVQTSTNTKKVLGLPYRQVLGSKLCELFGTQAFGHLEALLLQPTAHGLAEWCWSNNLTGRTYLFHAYAYPSGERIVLELEPAHTLEPTHSLKLHEFLHESFVALTASADLNTLCAAAARQVRTLTGFDRVMIYRFDEAWNGKVVAEVHSDDQRLCSYLGLHFPAADIPPMARTLFLLTGVRTIADVNARPAKLFPKCDPKTQAPLDMSCSLLRAVSPIHVEYLQNMQVEASLTIALVRRGMLWGLIACHHRKPLRISRALRIACKLIGQLLSVELTAREDAQDTHYLLELKASQNSFLEAVAREESLSDGLLRHQPTLLNRIASDGVALKLDDRMVLLGAAPPPAQTEALFEQLAAHTSEGVWATDALAHSLADVNGTFAGIGGVLALLLPGPQPRGVVWLRKEVLQTVHWGGDPQQTVRVDASNGSLHPRASFALWKEQVRGRSLAWKSCEIEAASQLRTVLTGLLLLRSERAADQANHALRLSEERFEAFLELSPTLAFIKDLQGRLLFASRLYAQRFGISPEQWRGKTDEQLWPADVALQIRTSDLAALEIDQPLEVTESLPLPDGKPSFWLTLKFPLPDLSGGKLLASMALDVSERRAAEAQIRTSLHEKEVLLREIHHRVKNNLQAIASLLKLQERQTEDPVAAAALAQSQDRVQSMALIHEHLYMSTSLAQVELGRYLEQLSASVMNTYGELAQRIHLERTLSAVQVDLDTAVPLGLITNELLTNALKHAFVGNRQGKVQLKLSSTVDGSLQLSLSDNGIGLPADLDPATARTLGLRLVRSLTRQLDGRLEVFRSNGTHFMLTVPVLANLK